MRNSTRSYVVTRHLGRLGQQDTMVEAMEVDGVKTEAVAAVDASDA